MTRSRKQPHYTLSKVWDKFKEKMFRRKVKKELRNIKQEIQFDPDRDFEESLEYNKMGSWGTRLGWDTVMLPDDTHYDYYAKAKRK